MKKSSFSLNFLSELRQSFESLGILPTNQEILSSIADSTLVFFLMENYFLVCRLVFMCLLIFHFMACVIFGGGNCTLLTKEHGEALKMCSCPYTHIRCIEAYYTIGSLLISPEFQWKL